MSLLPIIPPSHCANKTVIMNHLLTCIVLKHNLQRDQKKFKGMPLKICETRRKLYYSGYWSDHTEPEFSAV